MKSDKKFGFVSKVFSIILALALAVPLSMMFSTNTIAETTDTTPLTEIPGSEPILEGEMPINSPMSPEIDNPLNLSLPTFDFERPYDANYSIESELPIFEHVEESYNITLVTMNSPTGPLYEGERRPVQVILKNKADHNIKDINVDIYDKLDDGEPMFLTDLLYGSIPAGKEQKKTFTWEPEKGTHYLNLNISYIDDGIEQWNEEEFGFYVIPNIPEDFNDYDYSHGSYQGQFNDWTVESGVTLVQRVEIAPGVYRNELISDEGQTPPVVPTYIFFHQANIIVKNGGTLILDGTQFPIICDSDNQYTITVENGGTLEIKGNSLITATSSLYQGYGFEVHGTLNVLGTPTVNPMIRWMYGDMGDHTVPAGIQLYRGSDATFEYAKITEGESHNIYADGAEFTVTSCEISGAQSTGIACGIYAINGAEMHVGGGTEIDNNGHTGMYSEASSVDINDVSMINNEENGVSVYGDIEWQPGGWSIYNWNYEPWGRPDFNPGSDLGYFIWLDDQPAKNTWHIRWSGDGTGYSFNGELTLDGDRTYINPVGSVDSMGFPDLTTIYFEDYENSIEEGFDFRFDGSKVIFDLEIYDSGGTPVTVDTYIGATEIHVDKTPLRLCQMRPPVIRDLEISECKGGLLVFGRSLGVIESCIFSAYEYKGLTLDGTRMMNVKKVYAESKEVEAMTLLLSDYNTISNLILFTGYGFGLTLRYSDGNQIENVRVLGGDSIGAGIWTSFSDSNNFKGCQITGFQYGIVIDAYSNGNRIHDSEINDCLVGIVFYNNYNSRGGNKVSLSTIRGNGYGIFAYKQKQLAIDTSVVLENGFTDPGIDTYGIWIDASIDVVIRNSYVGNNKDPDIGDISVGIVITNSENIAIEGGTETRGSDYGIYAYSCTNLDIRDSTIAYNNIDGINVDSCTFAAIGNSIKRNGGIGVCFWNSNANQVYHNNFIENTKQAFDNGANFWDNGYPSGGNYWSDWTTPDNYDGPVTPQTTGSPDGIVDFPQVINGGFNLDYYPLAEPVNMIPHPPIRIDSDADFASTAVTEAWIGDGTPANPYIIENYDIDGTGYGYCIYIGNTTDYFVVRNCYLHDASGVDIYPFYYDSGLTLYKVQHGTITDNIADSNDFIGIYLEDSDSSNTVVNNIANFNGELGIGLEYSDGNAITGNTANSNGDFGIDINYSDGNLVSGNTANSNGFGGMYVNDAKSNVIEHNTVNSNSLYGFWLEDSLGNIITGNTVTWNSDYGIYVNGDSSNNWVHHNNFVNNKGGGVQACDDGINNHWDDGISEGNYWNDYETRFPTATNDGIIWDTPYTIDGGVGAQDNKPLVNPV